VHKLALGEVFFHGVTGLARDSGAVAVAVAVYSGRKAHSAVAMGEYMVDIIGMGIAHDGLHVM
jgi:hypothetical protein